MAVRIYLEIGHEASLRTKKTQEGFTHDWEVFVRGCESAEINYYIEKVVFYLHDTFPKPKRVVKEPPYSVKESGYAGFNLPIDIYLRNNSEPKKIRFNYDLHLQQSGPPIIKVQKEKYIFNSPNDEFRVKLLKGGGIVGNATIQEVPDTRSSLDDKNQMTNKPKLSGCDFIKKQKLKSGEGCRDFQELFGSPITMSSKPSSEQKTPKQDIKSVDKSRTKHSPHKDKEKSKDKTDSRSKDDKKQKDKSRDRERSKDKSIKKDRSPRPNSPSPKRSPKRFSSPPVVKHKEPKHDKDKRDKLEERKQKKEKRKDHKENKHADDTKANEEHKESKSKQETRKENKPKTEIAESPPTKVPEKKEKLKEKSLRESSKDDKSHSEKYKHKKKDKEKREKKEEKPKLEKKPEKLEVKPTLYKSELKKEKVPVPIIDDESSNSSTNSSSSSIQEKKPKVELTKPKEEKNQKVKKEDNTIKCKRKSDSVEVEEPPEKVQKEHGINNNADGDHDAKPPVKTVQKVEEDYFSVLQDLQHKIMELKDNAELQKVVKLIAETGRYEVSAHTFDFDLCLLDRSTVQQLQQFFNPDIKDKL